MVKRSRQNYIVQSVSHALDVLEAFKGDKDELGVTELSSVLGLPKNNVFRLLATLETRGYIEQNKTTGNYRLGIKTFELGQIFRRRMGLIKQAHSVLEELEAKCNESTYLAVIQEGMVVYVDMVETTHSVRIVPKLGQRVPAYCTAVGKTQMAYESQDEVEQILSKIGLRAFTPHTITDKQQLLEHLKQVAQQGYAIDNEELDEEVKCVATPVRDYTGQVVAGICISGPIQRMSDERIQNELIGPLKTAAQDISSRLGYVS
jgi:DNA-binding IclR family transcriptional regulator